MPPPSTVSFTTASQSNPEHIATVTVTARLAAPATQTVTVPFTISGTATAPGDYTISASPITIAAGQLSGSSTISVLDDGTDEANETVILTMGTPTNATQGATTVHTATIEDNDAAPTVSWSAASQSNLESVSAVTSAMASVGRAEDAPLHSTRPSLEDSTRVSAETSRRPSKDAWTAWGHTAG